MIRKFTEQQRCALQDLSVATHDYGEIQKAAHVLSAYHGKLDERLLEYEFDDLSHALERINAAFDAVKPLFPARQEEAA